MKPSGEAASERSGPQFVGYFWPVIEALKQLGGSARPAEVRERVVKNVGVSEDAQAEVTSNGRARFDNQVAWARFYLAKAGLIDASRRGVWSLTEAGRSLDALTPARSVELFRATAAEFGAGGSDESDAVAAVNERDAPPEAPSATTGVRFWKRSVVSRRLDLNVSASAYCASPDFSKWQSQANRTTAVLTVSGSCRSMRWSVSRFSFNARGTRVR